MEIYDFWIRGFKLIYKGVILFTEWISVIVGNSDCYSMDQVVVFEEYLVNLFMFNDFIFFVCIARLVIFWVHFGAWVRLYWFLICYLNKLPVFCSVKSNISVVGN